MRTRARKEPAKGPIQDPLLKIVKAENEPDSRELRKGGKAAQPGADGGPDGR